MINEGIELIKNSKRIVFMTGAGVSTASGIPDYRSMTGVYQGHENPEYLLSHTCLMREPEKFYDFVKGLYHPEAKPNIIHQVMKKLENQHEVSIISQNIDGLHDLASSSRVVNFHGNLNDLYCLKCQQSVTTEEYLKGYSHENCGGMIRPNVVLYEEGLSEEAIQTSIKWLSEADLVVIVGTTFKVYPFSGLIDYRNANSQILVVNNEEINLFEPHILVKQSAETFFAEL
ncbi:NAD-dependent protein deacylase [Vagococcus fluvialis]|uniref:NAD-dependent protein deacylase n=1 Tax=Vagococcus fluvialis TaxID=2738 RepID=UPI003B5C57FD